MDRRVGLDGIGTGGQVGVGGAGQRWEDQSGAERPVVGGAGRSARTGVCRERMVDGGTESARVGKSTRAGIGRPEMKWQVSTDVVRIGKLRNGLSARSGTRGFVLSACVGAERNE